MTVREVTSQEFDQITELLDRARVADRAAKRPGLTLAKKLECRDMAKGLRARAMAIAEKGQ